jgi:hypothetical protein
VTSQGHSFLVLAGASPSREKHENYVMFHYGNKGTLSSVSDVDPYVITIKLLDSILSVLPTFIRWWEIETYLHKMFLP